uniref:Uncharacterized protein n=1 Tax=Parastrongyloides trichosuri TaxID=131310 RepID=A0A0N4ZN24_PARTI
MWRPIEPKEWDRNILNTSNDNTFSSKEVYDYNDINLIQDIQNMSSYEHTKKHFIFDQEIDPWKVIRLLFMINLIQFVILISLFWYIKRRNRFFFEHFIQNQQ